MILATQKLYFECGCTDKILSLRKIGLGYNKGLINFKNPYNPATIVSKKPADRQTGVNQENSNGISPEIPVKMQPVEKQQAAEKIFRDLVIPFKRIGLAKSYRFQTKNQ